MLTVRVLTNLPVLAALAMLQLLVSPPLLPATFVIRAMFLGTTVVIVPRELVTGVVGVVAVAVVTTVATPALMRPAARPSFLD